MTVAKSLQALARKINLFGYIGQEQGGARYLYLQETSKVFVPEDAFLDSLVVPREAYGKSITNVAAALFDSDSEMPIKLSVAGHLKMATSMGDQYGKEVGDTFTISAGKERNRLLLTPDTKFGHFVPYEYRLTAEEVVQIVDAMKGDVSHYAEEIGKERESARRLSADVTAMVKNLSDKIG